MIAVNEVLGALAPVHGTDRLPYLPIWTSSNGFDSIPLGSGEDYLWCWRRYWSFFQGLTPEHDSYECCSVRSTGNCRSGQSCKISRALRETYLITQLSGLEIWLRRSRAICWRQLLWRGPGQGLRCLLRMSFRNWKLLVLCTYLDWPI